MLLFMSLALLTRLWRFHIQSQSQSLKMVEVRVWDYNFDSWFQPCMPFYRGTEQATRLHYIFVF